MESTGHASVLLKEAIDFLNVRRDGIYIDATVGLGGHSFEGSQAASAPRARLIGFDKDPAAPRNCRTTITRQMLLARGDQAPTVILHNASFTEAKGWKGLVDPEVAQGLTGADGLLADLGLELDAIGRRASADSVFFRQTARSICGWIRKRSALPIKW